VKVIRLLAMADGSPCPVAGEFVETFDPDAAEGRGHLTVTDTLLHAKLFPTAAEAWQFWRQTSRAHPVRLTDGKPNRPMTAFTVSIEDAP
jgi:hypothetical protein